MDWEEMCIAGGGTIAGKKIDLKTLNQDGIAKRADVTGMVDHAVLQQMMAAASKLKLPKATTDRKGKDKDGIAFHIARFNFSNEGGAASHTEKSEYVDYKAGPAVCYENTILPLDNVANGHLIIHQGLAPCTRCRAGYRKWAMERNCMIVVQADENYDRTGVGQPTFIFSATGRVLYG